MKSARIPVRLAVLVSAACLCLASSSAGVGADRPARSQRSSSVRNQSAPVQTPASLWKGSIVRENGVEIVRNPEQPIYGEDALELTEEYVIPASGPDGEYTFVRPADLILGPKENLYVVDIRDCNIKVFDNQGRFIRIIGKPGPGPGELLQPSRLDFCRNQLWVYSASDRNLTVFDPDGAFLREVQAGASFMAWKMDAHGNSFALVAIASKGGQPDFVLQKFGSDMRLVKTVAVDEWREPGLMMVQLPSFALFQDDRIIRGRPYAYTDKYELDVFDNGGTLLKKIQRAGRPDRIPRTETDYLKKTRKPFVGQTWNDLPERYAPFYSFQTDDRDRIIVRTRFTMDGQPMDFYDVFNPEGYFLARIALKQARSRLWANGRLYALDEDENGYWVVKVYRVKWSFEQES